MNADRTRPRPPSPTTWTTAFVLLFALWMLFVDTIAATEVIAGLVAATIAATAAEAARYHGGLIFRPPISWLGRAWRLPFRMVRDFGLVTVALARELIRPGRVRGSFRAVPFPVGREDPRSVARRTIAAAAGSFAPNGIVVGFDRDRNLLLVHELVPTHPPSRTMDLIRP
jgi:multisubunit Na+/H+ antiporter MnhE subunit